MEKDLGIFLNFIKEKKPEWKPDEEKIKIYYNMIIEMQKRIALISKKDLYRIARKHFLDSVLLIELLKENSLMDIGSGAGFPGIPISIFSPNLKITLLERNLRKYAFLNKVKLQLELKNVNVVRKDLIELDNIEQKGLVTRAGNYKKIFKILLKKGVRGKRFYSYVPIREVPLNSVKSFFEKEMKNEITGERFKIFIFEL